MNPAVKSLWISSPMILRFSSSKRRSSCFTGLEPARISKECSATSLGMPGMSEGLHANISAFARRKSTSTASYLGSRSALIVSTLPSELLGSSGIFLVPSASSKLPAWHMGSEASRPGPRASRQAQWNCRQLPHTRRIRRRIHTRARRRS